MLFRRAADGSVALADDTDTLDKPCYDYKGLARSAEFLEKLVSSLKRPGFDVYQIDHEDANGQFEVNFTYADALTTADRFVFFKMAAAEIAKSMGLVASFMPKPFSNKTGTGAHFHISHGRRERQEPVPRRPRQERPGAVADGVPLSRRHLRPCARPDRGGRAEHQLVQAPGGGTRACRARPGRPPTSLTATTTAPPACAFPTAGSSCACRTARAIPYLASAAILAAGMDGVERKLDPGKPINENLYEWSPQKLDEAGVEAAARRTCWRPRRVREGQGVARGAGRRAGGGVPRPSSAWNGSSTRAMSRTGSATLLEYFEVSSLR